MMIAQDIFSTIYAKCYVLSFFTLRNFVKVICFTCVVWCDPLADPFNFCLFFVIKKLWRMSQTS